MNFKTFFFDLPGPMRTAFATRADTSTAYLTQVAYCNKRIELGLADVIVACSNGMVTLDDLPLTENAQRQRAIREGRHPEPRPATAKA